MLLLLQAKEVADAMVADAKGVAELAALRVDGGVSMSDPLMQYQARGPPPSTFASA